MALNVEQQINEFVKNSQSILIALPEQPSIDAITGSLVLFHSLQKQDKHVEILSPNFKKPERLSFLPRLDFVKPETNLAQKSIIEIDTGKYPIADLSYHMKGQHLQIVVSPKERPLTNDAVAVKSAEHPFDLIITINLPELPALGRVYQQHRRLFDELPIINIDHRPDNEQYGQINWIDLKSSSTCEMLYHHFFSGITPKKDIATTLLAGIMDETQSFRKQQVNPRTLDVVSQLLRAGADHETVVTRLYRTKTVGALRLWGHVLDNLQADRELSLAWSVIPHSVFATTGTTMDQLHELMHEVLSHSPEAKTIVLFVEKSGDPPASDVYIATTPPIHAKDLVKNWQPHGSEHFAVVKVPASLADSEKQVIRVVKERLRQVLLS